MNKTNTISGKTLLSVIIPVYNVEKYIERCLDSLLKQEISQTEILLIDDGSTDNSSRICDIYAGTYNFVKVIHKKNGGLVSARNAGLDEAKGEWITFVDSDDSVSSDYISTIKSLIYKETDAAIFSYAFINDLGSTRKISEIKINEYEGSTAECVREAEAKGIFHYAWNKLYKKQIIEREVPLRFTSNSEPGEDFVFNCQYYIRTSAVVLCNKSIYKYYKQGSIEQSLSHKYWPDLYEKTKTFVDFRCRLYEHLGMDTERDKREIAKQNVYYLFKCIPNMYRKGNKLPARKRRDYYSEILKDQRIRMWMNMYKNGEAVIKMYRFLYKMGSAAVFDTVYSIVFEIKNLLNR